MYLNVGHVFSTYLVCLIYNVLSLRLVIFSTMDVITPLNKKKKDRIYSTSHSVVLPIIHPFVPTH